MLSFQGVRTHGTNSINEMNQQTNFSLEHQCIFQHIGGENKGIHQIADSTCPTKFS